MSDRELPPASFEGAELNQMRKWVQSGAGAEAYFNNASKWEAEDKFLRGLKDEIDAKLKQVGAVMQSESGEAMKDQAMPVVLWHEVAADSAKLQSETMTAQGEAFKKVQTSIPAKGEEQDVPDDTWIEEGWDTLTTGSTDAEDAKAHNEKLRQEGVQAFTAYQETTQGNVSGSAVFEKPPPIAVQSTSASGTPGPGVGGVDSSSPSSTSSAWAGGSGSGSGGSAGGAGGSGGSGGSLGSGGAAGTGSAWANTPGGGANQNPGGAGRVPGGPGTPGMPGGGLGIGGPGAGGAGAGRGGAGGAGGGRGGAGAGGRGGLGAGGRAGGPGMGAGGRSGMGGLGGASGAGGAGGAGGRGGAGAGAGAGARGRGQEGEDDLEHETPDYLVGDQGVFDEDLPRVAPPVFGDWDNQR